MTYIDIGLLLSVLMASFLVVCMLRLRSRGISWISSATYSINMAVVTVVYMGTLYCDTYKDHISNIESLWKKCFLCLYLAVKIVSILPFVNDMASQHTYKSILSCKEDYNKDKQAYSINLQKLVAS